MLLTERELRKVIQNTILEHSRQKDFRMLSEEVKRSKVLVSTNRGTGHVTFGSLLEGIDRGQVSSRQVGIILENDLRSIRKEMLQEGLLDMVSDAYESVKAGAIKLKDTISDTTAKAMAALNDKYIEWTVKLWMMMQKGKEYAMKGVALIGKALGSIKRFKKKHPILYKIIMITLVCIVLYAIMAIFASHDANAAITGASKVSAKNPLGTMSDRKYNATLGVLKDILKDTPIDDMENQKRLFDAMTALEKAHKAKENIPVDTLNSTITTAVETLNAGIREARASGDSIQMEAMLNAFKKLEAVGQNAKVTIQTNSGDILQAPMGI